MNSSSPSPDSLIQMASRWLPDYQVPQRIRILTDTTEFFGVEYDDVVLLEDIPYLIRHNAREERFGLEDEVKYWVKRAVDLTSGDLKIMKLVFYEKFMTRIGRIEFECFRSPAKEARILTLVAGHPNFMQGHAVKDTGGNLIRVIDFIRGKPLSTFIGAMDMGHEEYFHTVFPSLLGNFMECVRAIGFLHEHGEKHGDIRRDHILIDRDTGKYIWIDFDFNYRHRENIFGYDLFGLGNILCFLAGKGDILLRDLDRKISRESLEDGDMNIVFHNRVVNLKKIFPYIPEPLNRILLHFSRGANRFYDTTSQMIQDLEEYRSGVLL